MSFQMEGLTEEQNKAIESEIERRVTQAVKTNTDNVTQKLTKELSEKYAADYQKKLGEAIAVSSNDTNKQMEAMLQTIKDQQAQFAKERMTYRAERKLHEAGISEEAIGTLIPLFIAGATDETLDSNLQMFIDAQTNAINTALQKQKESLALGANPPASGGSDPGQHQNNPDAAVQQILKQNTDNPHYGSAMAIQYLLDNQQ